VSVSMRNLVNAPLDSQLLQSLPGALVQFARSIKTMPVSP
jgi:hypothetical protein